MAESKVCFDVCIVGAGPAGMVAALGLLKLGHSVIVLEKNVDFTREFRGEVLQPRFWRALRRYDLDKIVRKFDHEEFSRLDFYNQDHVVTGFDVADVSGEFPFITWMTQPILLGGLQRECQKFPNFKIVFNANVQSLQFDGLAVKGLKYTVNDQQNVDGTIVQSKVVIGSDGRNSSIRTLAGLDVAKREHQFDVIWFEANRPESFPKSLLFFFSGPVPCLVLPKYPNKIQAGLLVHPKRARDLLKKDDNTLIELIEDLHPLLKGVGKDLVNRKHFTVLAGIIEELETWSKAGLLMIGDAAHTCSPAGAIGVSIAVETAVYAIEVVDTAIKSGDCSASALSRLQKQRTRAIRDVHAIQRRASTFINAPQWLRQFGLQGIKFANYFGIVTKVAKTLIV